MRISVPAFFVLAAGALAGPSPAFACVEAPEGETSRETDRLEAVLQGIEGLPDCDKAGPKGALCGQMTVTKCRERMPCKHVIGGGWLTIRHPERDRVSVDNGILHYMREHRTISPELLAELESVLGIAQEKAGRGGDQKEPSRSRLSAPQKRVSRFKDPFKQ